MKLEKAIEIVSLSANAGMTTFNQDYKNAQKLLIEAGKRIEQCRIKDAALVELPLPGETID